MINLLNASVALIEKPVNWFAQQTTIDLRATLVFKTLQSILWIPISILLEYLMKFNSVSLDWRTIWNSQSWSFFLRLLHSTYTIWNFQFRVNYPSHLIKLVLAQPQKINLKKLNLTIWCYQYTAPPELKMVNRYNDNILNSMRYTYATSNFQAVMSRLLHCNQTAYN